MYYFCFLQYSIKIVGEANSEVFAKSQKPLYALILTPTRELAIQVNYYTLISVESPDNIDYSLKVNNHISAAAKYTGIRTAVVVGGLASEKQERLLAKEPEIVVATPGRLWELIQDGNPHLSQLDNIRLVS